MGLSNFLSYYDRIISILKYVFCFFLGFLFCHFFFPNVIKDTPSVIDSIPVSGTVVAETKTDVQYIEKESSDDSDIDIDIKPVELKVKVNDKEVNIKKSVDEKYVFDKNKLSLNQASKAEFSVKVEPVYIDNTKHWGFGLGTDLKTVYGKVDFPINKKSSIDGWVIGSPERIIGGVTKRF